MAQPLKPEDRTMLDEIGFYRRQGYADDQVMTILKNKGFNEEALERMFAQPKGEFKGTAIKAGGRKLDWKSMLITFFLFAIAAGAVLVMWSTFFGGPSMGALSSQLVGSLSGLGIGR